MEVRKVMSAILALYEGKLDFSQYVEANDVIDNYRNEFPETALTDALNIYIEACENYDQPLIDKFANAAYNWLVRNGS